MPKDGLFIVFEGIDGAGTTTQMRRLEENLVQNGYGFVRSTAEPSNSQIGRLIRYYLGYDGRSLPSWETMALLFAADRKRHCDTEIRPFLELGGIVVCDRYKMSTLAYQSATAAQGISDEFAWYSQLREATSWIERISLGVWSPDLTIYLDVSVEVAQKRVAERNGTKEVYEGSAFQEKVREVYRLLCKEHEGDLVVIDGDRDEGVVAEGCFQSVVKKLEEL